jgi:hypothetical protein
MNADLRIPNLVARGLYVERLRERWLPPTDAHASRAGCRARTRSARRPDPAGRLHRERYFRVLSNRDYRWTNELLVKFAFLTLLFDDRLYMAVSELETERGMSIWR